ncbi:MAG TPA: endonuclease III [Acholeplasmataceae bacterium]|nr:endonuclease III [Acholeplasmataceae bacterium]
MNKLNVILNTLNDMYPDAHVELTHQSHFQLLVAVVLSAQTTDKAVNKVTPKLFEVFPDANALSKASIQDVIPLIKTIGLYQNKAKNIILLSQQLMTLYKGIVPSDRASLEALPGVGRKTANVVLSNAFNIPAFAVDTHVERVSKRLRLARKNDSVLVVEQKLMKKIPKKHWTKLHHQLIFFGRYHCTAKQPNCNDCPLFDMCVYPLKHKK